MTALEEVVRAFADRADIAAVVLLSSEGLPIHAGGAPTLDVDSTAALAATFSRHAAVLADSAGMGQLETAVLETAVGLLVVARVGSDWLLVLPEKDADAGTLLYDIRCQRPAVAALL